MIKDLWYSPGHQNYFYVGQDLMCPHCGARMEYGVPFMFSVRFRLDNTMEWSVSCSRCIDKIPYNQKMAYQNSAIYTVKVPIDAHEPVFTPETEPGKVRDVFQAVSLKSTHTVDKTKHALRETWDGASIGDTSYERIEGPVLTPDKAIEYIKNQEAEE